VREKMWRRRSSVRIAEDTGLWLAFPGLPRFVSRERGRGKGGGERERDVRDGVRWLGAWGGEAY
jgi:hypothetical protein